MSTLFVTPSFVEDPGYAEAYPKTQTLEHVMSDAWNRDWYQWQVRMGKSRNGYVRFDIVYTGRKTTKVAGVYETPRSGVSDIYYLEAANEFDQLAPFIHLKPHTVKGDPEAVAFRLVAKLREWDTANKAVDHQKMIDQIIQG